MKISHFTPPWTVAELLGPTADMEDGRILKRLLMAAEIDETADLDDDAWADIVEALIEVRYSEPN